MKLLLLNAEANHIPLADESVDCVATSPPYWGLRKYAGVDPRSFSDAWRGDLGLEPTPEMYVAHIVEVFREVWRVLKPTGSLWLNLGDGYAGSGGAHTKDHANPGLSRSADRDGVPHYQQDGGRGMNKLVQNLKPKDLCGIPWRVAFALQADGWWLRSDIIWAKPNPMPESVTDRPTKAHEYLFLLTKSQHYYYDQEAVREKYAPASLPRAMRGLSEDNKWSDGAPGSTAHTISQARPNAKLSGSGQSFGGDGHSGYIDANGRLLINPNGRNMRDVWTIATQSYKGAHYATFPEALVEPCIKAGSSERGCCPKCGKPWARIVEVENKPSAWKSGNPGLLTVGKQYHKDHGEGTKKHTAIGWQPTCKCGIEETVPAIILDPFAGSGTTLLVARRLGRSSVGIDLSYEYLHNQARKRLELDKLEAWTNGGTHEHKN